MIVEKSPEISKKFNCELCYYNTNKKLDFNKHLQTVKHIIKENDSKMVVNDSDLSQKVAKKYECECGKAYKYDSGYYRHKKNCSKNKVVKDESGEITDKELIIMLLKQNALLIEQNTELAKKGTHNVSNSHNNSHNKTFNLQFFLNETCKDAMNITEFVDSINYKLTDLEKMGEFGYVEGITNIITSNLNALDVTKRPIHCADNKREVLYIKDDNKWEKENEDKRKIRKVIRRVANNNTRLLSKYKETHPDCDGKKSEQYNKMIIEAMGGLGNDDKEKEDKIIRNISKNVIIDKSII
jgi:hypothetical protein